MDMQALKQSPAVLAIAPSVLLLAVMHAQWPESVAPVVPVQPTGDMPAIYDHDMTAIAAQAVDINTLMQKTGQPASQFRLRYRKPPLLDLPPGFYVDGTKKASLKLVVAASGQVIRVEIVRSSGIAALDQLLLEGCKQAVFYPLDMPGKPQAFITYQPFDIEPPD